MEFEKDHWIRKNFEYVYKNPLWEMNSPKQYSLCTYFWKSIIIGMLFMRLVVVPFGLVAGFILGKGCGPVGVFLWRQWKPVFDGYEDDTFGRSESAILGFLFTIMALLVASLLFMVSMATSYLFVSIDFSSVTMSNVGVVVLVLGVMICGLFGGMGLITNLLYPNFFREKNLARRLIQMGILYASATVITNIVGIVTGLWLVVSSLAIAAWGVMTDPFIMVFEAFLVAMGLLYWKNSKDIIRYQSEWRMVMSDYVYLGSVFLAMYERHEMDRVFAEIGFDMSRVSEETAFNMRVDFARRIILNYRHHTRDFGFDSCIKKNRDSYDDYVKATEKMKHEMARDRSYPFFAEDILNTSMLCDLYSACEIFNPEFYKGKAKEVADSRSTEVPTKSKIIFSALVAPTIFDIWWESICSGAGQLWHFAKDFIKAKKEGMCPVLNLEQEGE